MTSPKTPTPQAQPVSALMRALIESASEDEHVPVGRILQIFGVRGFAFLLLTLALLNIFIFMIPFVSLLFGIPMIILAAQMVVGVHTPIFPRVIRRSTIPRDILAKALNKAIEGVEKIERYIKPRFSPLSNPHFDRLHGLMAMVLAIMVALPIPLFNVPPSVALALLSIGMLQRDGIFIILAYAIGLWCILLFKSLGHMAHSLAI